jgi:hypothetical protein
MRGSALCVGLLRRHAAAHPDHLNQAAFFVAILHGHRHRVAGADQLAHIGIQPGPGKPADHHRVVHLPGHLQFQASDPFWGRFTRDLLRRYEFLPTRRTIITRAAALCLIHSLRGFDAIHLASGL